MDAINQFYSLIFVDLQNLRHKGDKKYIFSAVCLNRPLKFRHIYTADQKER